MFLFKLNVKKSLMVIVSLPYNYNKSTINALYKPLIINRLDIIKNIFTVTVVFKKTPKPENLGVKDQCFISLETKPEKLQFNFLLLQLWT